MFVSGKLRQHQSKVEQTQMYQMFLFHVALEQLPELDDFLLEERMLGDQAE
jgi:hypothetical protein